jgi:DNA repair exonuclease SbcCD ATPase subunit
VSQAKSQTPQELQAEVTRLNEELQMREQLIQQLSQELFRLVKGDANLLPSPEASERHQVQMVALREQLQEMEQQVKFYQGQIAERDTEAYQLRQSVEELTDRSRMLEQVVQELPGVYRQKFSERLNEVMEKVELLQRENKQLHAELQSVSYRLAQKSRRPSGLDLPSFQGRGSGSVEIPTLGNA